MCRRAEISVARWVTHAKNKNASRTIQFSVVGFWGKIAMVYAGIMPFHRECPATTRIWASKPGTGAQWVIRGGLGRLRGFILSVVPLLRCPAPLSPLSPLLNTLLSQFSTTRTSFPRRSSSAPGGHSKGFSSRGVGFTMVGRPMSCVPGYFEVINTHTVGFLTIPRASIKWV